MSKPYTISEIVAERTKKVEAEHASRKEKMQQAQGALSDEQNQTVTLNVVPSVNVLTILCWNIQTFEAGKSLKNPFVNLVINGVLEALSTDICVLLETRANSYINMNGIESGEKNDGKWTQSGEDDEIDAEYDDGEEDDSEGDPVDDSLAADDNGDPVDESVDVEDDDDPGSMGGTEDEREELNGGEPLRYIQLASDMTGKRWSPPARIYIYHPDTVAHTRLVREWKKLLGLSSKLGKFSGKSDTQVESLMKIIAAVSPRKEAVKLYNKTFTASPSKPAKSKKPTVKETNALLRMYASLNKEPKRYDGVKNISASEARFASEYQFHPKWLKAHTVEGNAPSNIWKTNLLSGAATPLRTYYGLHILDDNFDTVPHTDWNTVHNKAASENSRFVLCLHRCPQCHASLGKGECAHCEDYGPLTTNLNNLRQTIDAITFYRSAAQESYSVLVRPSTVVTAPSSEGIWLQGKRVQVGTIAAHLLMREPAVKKLSVGNKAYQSKAGKLLGYQDGTSSFYGRCPYYIPLQVWPPFAQAPESLALIAFHGPFGASTNAGIEARSVAMEAMLAADIGASGRRLRDIPNALIIGDFNLDWSPLEDRPDTKKTIANALYKKFESLDFKPMIEGGIASSLISIHGPKQAWRTVAPLITNFTSSAYDNLFMKGDGIRSYHMHSCVVDAISWIESHLADFEIDPDDSPPKNFSALPPKTQAFYIYHRYVSDHLPVLCDIWVQDMAENSNAAQYALKLRALLNTKPPEGTISGIDVVMKCESVLEFGAGGVEADVYTPTDEGASRRARIVGRVYGYVESSIVVVCNPIGKDRLWFGYIPEDKDIAMHGKSLQSMLDAYPTGTKVVATVLNPSYVL